jgi:DNA-binding transcriptional regulator YhcF (GntR family)
MVRVGRDTVVRELRDRIVAGIHVGRLRAGTRLPSVRTLAHQFDVNERVVLAALRELATDGFVDLRPRSGSYVAQLHGAAGTSLPDLGAWLVDVLVQARARGLAPRGLSEYVRSGMETRRIRAACVECNYDQLHLLCQELVDDHGIIAESTPLDQFRADDPPPSVRRADVLVTTAFHTDRVRKVAKQLGKPWIAVELRADMMRDVGQLLRAGVVYYIATDPRFEKKLRRMLAAVGPVENLRVLIVGRADLSDIPPNAPTFVMPSARQAVRKNFGPDGFPGRPIHPPRYFSDESARELLSFIVRTNMTAQRAAAPSRS